ncbi:MAG TPA: hypothetical protein VKN99_06095 [Polyangia bacterium]|nr:hypothetical protein [Polyangia bacterium]
MGRWGACLVLSALGLAALFAGCFNPEEPVCEFACAQAPNQCPSGYECRADHYCHRVGTTGPCPNFPGTEASLPDAPIDANLGDGEADGMPDAPPPDARADAPPPDAPPPDAPLPDAPETDGNMTDAT